MTPDDVYYAVVEGPQEERYSMEQAIHLTDLGKCTPGEALSDVATEDQWLVVDYDAGEPTH